MRRVRRHAARGAGHLFQGRFFSSQADENRLIAAC